MTALTLEGIVKRFGPTTVLHDIDLSVPEGSFTAILGPSGCGKTTLLRLVAGFADPDDGRICFGDRLVFDGKRSIPPQRRRVGYVPQEGALFPHIDVASNIGFGLPRGQRRKSGRVDELLELVGLPFEMRSRFPHQLSGGQQQRVALARALAPNPSVVLLDEPFASLDAGLREGTGRAVAAALRMAHATAVLVTHDQDEALSLADQVAVMRDGRLVQSGSPKDVYESPVDIWAAEFVGAAVILDTTPSESKGGMVSTSLGQLPVNGDATKTERVMLRPEQIRVRPTNVEGVPAVVTEVSYFGHDAFVRLQLPTNNTNVLARVMGDPLPAVGDHVHLAVVGAVTAL